MNNDNDGIDQWVRVVYGFWGDYSRDDDDDDCNDVMMMVMMVNRWWWQRW
jgi:hypothetical protein